jgi:hypothetical protein
MTSKVSLNGYIKEGKNALVRHLNVQYFQFLVLNDVHVLRYKLGSIPINTIVWAWMPKKEHCKKTKINKCGVEVVLDLLERIP